MIFVGLGDLGKVPENRKNNNFLEQKINNLRANFFYIRQDSMEVSFEAVSTQWKDYYDHPNNPGIKKCF